MHLTGKHYATGRPIQVEIENGLIATIRPLPAGTEHKQDQPWIAPGFVDLQINGYGGQEFSSPDLTSDKVASIVESQAAFGVTHLLPTVTTGSLETLAHGLATIAEACDSNPRVARSVPGIHLEGPFISVEDGPRGAHPLEHCRKPDWSEFERLQEAAGGRIRLLTLSAEYAEAPAFIRRAVERGVVIALGHMSATAEQIRTAVDAGASLSTHLGNGAHRMLRRHPNYIWDQLAEDRLTASLIVDGHHLPAAVVKTFVRAKSPQRCILVSDVSGLAGLPPGVYDTNLCQLEILPSGRVVIAGQDQLLAGASLPIGVGIANVMQYAEIDLAAAVDMASLRPASIIGIEVGPLEVGGTADLVLFTLDRETESAAPRLEVQTTIAGGELIYGAV